METNEKILVFLLWLVGGFIGLHQFYLGNKKQGIASIIVFCMAIVLTLCLADAGYVNELPFLPLIGILLFYFALLNDLIRTLRS